MQSKSFHNISVWVVVILGIIVLIWIGGQAIESTPLDIESEVATSTPPALAILEVKAPKGTVRAIVAATPQATARGLSGMDSLPKDSGMLFIFPSAGAYGFWMKEMNFPIDMIWIGVDKTVSGVTPGVRPETYPEIFYPPSDVSYVLELNSGGARDYGIATGTKLVF